MNVKKTYKFFRDHDVVALKANKAKSAEVGEKLIELGNSQQAIPFYAVYAPGLDQPVTFAPGIMSADHVIDQIEKAIGHPSNSPAAAVAEAQDAAPSDVSVDRDGGGVDSGESPDRSDP